MLSLESETVAQGSNFKKVAAATTVAASLAIAGVIVSTQSSTKSASKLALITIPEEFSGTFALENTAGNLKYDGKFHKFEHEDGDWQVDAKIVLTGEGMGFGTDRSWTYTLKDDVMVQEVANTTSGEIIKTECVKDATWIPYGEAKGMLASAVVVNSEAVNSKILADVTERCPEGSELAIVSDNGHGNWFVCGDMSAKGVSMTAYNGNFEMKVNSVEGMVVEVQHPAYFDLEANNCTAQNPAHHFIEAMTKGVGYEHRATAVDQTEQAWPFVGASEEIETDGRALSSKYFVCRVFHGLANAGMSAWDPNYGGSGRYYRDAIVPDGGQNNWRHRSQMCSNYRCSSDPKVEKGSVYGARNFDFGSLANCSHALFSDMDTQIRPFYDRGTTSEFNVLVGDYHSNRGLRAITHSMAGLIMQYGLMWGQIRRTTSGGGSNGWQWLQVQNPWYGSYAANQGVDTCSGIISFLLRLGGGQDNKLIMKEVCIRGTRIGKNSWGQGNKVYPLPATRSITLHKPYHSSYGNIDSTRSSNKRRGQKRMCGVSPKGNETAYEEFFFFNIIAQRLTRASGVWKPSMSSRVSNRWGSGLNLTINKSMGAALATDWAYYKWSDGAVDAHNCMNALHFGMSTSSSNMYLTATNHDSGTCRAGAQSTSYQNGCSIWAAFAGYNNSAGGQRSNGSSNTGGGSSWNGNNANRYQY